MYYKKHFTIAEARACLPELRKQIHRINDLLAEIKSVHAQELTSYTAIIRSNGKGPIVMGTSKQKVEAQELIDNIVSQGIIIKDIQQGLVDFPHFLNDNTDHEVLLCWRLDEDTIEYWHEIEAGFVGRQRL